jgi:hypothetical protein
MLPPTISLNAWLGPAVSADVPLAADAATWLGRQRSQPAGQQLFPRKVSERDWQDEEVGWGLLLPDDPSLPQAQRGEPVGAPEPVRQLWRDRDTPPVFRVDPTSPKRGPYLRRYARDGSVTVQDLDKAATPYGRGVNRVPYYLLIVGGPQAVPWEVQLRLNLTRAVGRLDLNDDGLANYVTALRSGWRDSRACPLRAVLWATGYDRVTHVLRRAIAERLRDRFRGDPTPAIRDGLTYLEEGAATAAALVAALRDNRPGLVVTTGHGWTDLGDPRLTERVGAPVDQQRQPLEAGALTADWQPDGAVWYALACCSAGTNDRNRYNGLLNPTSEAHRGLEELARRLGAATAPLPRSLLGARRPLRAFIGHVEPTFDRTMHDPVTKQHLGDRLVAAFHGDSAHSLYHQDSAPVGLALRPHFQTYSDLVYGRREEEKRLNAGDGTAEGRILDAELRACDVCSTVILGDPTVALDFNGFS